MMWPLSNGCHTLSLGDVRLLTQTRALAYECDRLTDGQTNNGTYTAIESAVTEMTRITCQAVFEML